MKYTFHSTDPDNFNEIYCPIIFPGVCNRVRWYMQDLTSNHNIIVLDTTDYIIFYTQSDSHTNDTYGTITWNPSKQFTSLSSFMTDFNSQDATDMTLEQTDIGTYRFKSTSGAFDITSMSYNVKQALGFYYVSDGTTLNSSIGTTTTTSSSTTTETSLLANTTDSTTTTSMCYYNEAKTMGYSNFTTV